MCQLNKGLVFLLHILMLLHFWKSPVLLKNLICDRYKLNTNIRIHSENNKTADDNLPSSTHSLYSFSPDTSQLTKVSLTSASLSSDLASPPAPWVETCSCPPGFAGQFCEQCAPGFTREEPGNGPLSKCVPCICHRHGTCHQETGKKKRKNL